MIKRLTSRGILYSLGVVFNRIVPARLFRFRLFRVCQLQPHEAGGKSAGESALQFHWCTSDADFRLAEDLTLFQYTSDEQQLGYEACLVFEATQPIGGLWRAEKGFDEEELGVRVDLDDDQAWIFSATVSKQHRCRGVYRQLLGHVLTSDSRRYHFVAINPTNRRSMAAHRQFVRSRVGTCVSFRLFQIAVSLASGGLELDRHVSLGCRKQPIRMRLATVDPIA